MKIGNRFEMALTWRGDEKADPEEWETVIKSRKE